MNDPSPQSGNVLFYILMCVGLFAALGYAFSRGGTSGADKISDDKARLLATEIIDHGLTVREGMAKLKLRGCTESQFQLSTNSYLRNNDTPINTSNSNAPANGTCSPFVAGGGGLNPFIASPEAIIKGYSTGSLSWKEGHGGFRVYQVTGAGTSGTAGLESANDLVFNINYLNLAVCKAINKLAGTQDFTVGTLNGGEYTNGSFASSDVLNNGNARMWCAEKSGWGQFGIVVLAR